MARAKKNCGQMKAIMRPITDAVKPRPGEVDGSTICAVCLLSQKNVNFLLNGVAFLTNINIQKRKNKGIFKKIQKNYI